MLIEQNQREMEGLENMMRKEKRKAMKKMKRKQMRKEIALKEREEEEAILNDPEEQMRMKLMEQEEAERTERERKEFEERERAWIEAMERKKKAEEEEEERRRVLEGSRRQPDDKENESDDAEDWEYVEEGPAEIIWQGNEIIVRKKRVRVSKKDATQLIIKEDADRPTSNPLPPQSEAFVDYQNASLVSAQQALENVAQQIPNFGTEQDKAHCPFHLKTGACRFGQRCSRVHFYPDKSCTLLIKNMYNGPGLAWEQDEGLEHTDEEIERCYEEFYEDVHTEFLKFGEIVNFKVCKNGSFHLRGNVYVHYKSLESAVPAYHSVSGRYFAGKQVKCEFINVTRWKVAICGEYMKSRLKTCSHGTACNFIHCFRNPGGDYEWADWDKPPPKYWVRKMAALFGYSDESGYEKQMEQEHSGQLRKSSKNLTTDGDRHRSKRSRSREMDHMNSYSGRSRNRENDVRESTYWQKYTNDDKKQNKILEEKLCKENTNFNDYRHSESRSHETSSDGGWLDRDQSCTRKSAKHQSKMSESLDKKKRTHDTDSDGDWSDRDRDRQTHYRRAKKSSSQRSKVGYMDDNEDSKNRIQEGDGDQLDGDLDKETRHSNMGKSPGHWSKPDDHGGINDSDDIDSIGEVSDRDRDRRRGHRRKSLGQLNNISEFSDAYGDGKYGTHNTDSINDLLDKDKGRYCSHRRKPSRRQTEVSEFSDDEAEPTKKLKVNFHSGEHESEKSELRGGTTPSQSGRRSCSSKEIGKVDALDGSLKLNGDHESRSSGRYDGRCELHDTDLRYISNENIDKQDRWEPDSPKDDWKSRGVTTSVESFEVGSSDRYNGRSKSQDLSSEYCYNEKVDGGCWESENDASDKHHKLRSKFTCDRDPYHSKSNSNDQHSRELYSESRSRASSRSSRGRLSKCMEKETYPSEDYQDFSEKYKKTKKCSSKHGSDGHKRHDKKWDS